MVNASGDFAVAVVPDRQRVVVAPAGELDFATAAGLWEEIAALRDSGFERIVLDLRGLTFMDVSGLHVIERARREAAEDDFDFALIEGDEKVCRVLELAGVREQLRFTRPSARHH